MKSDVPSRDPLRLGSPATPEPASPPPDLAADDGFPTRCPDSLMSGSLFAGRYRILRELGRGGMGIVSQATDTRLPRDVAIKVPLRFQDPDSRRRFFKEAEAAAKLDHPHICRILDIGEADGLPFIVLAFIAGRTLAEIVARRPVGPIGAAKIARNIARTIQVAHDRGIIHRDLKPANLMVGPHRELIVMDFGLARLEGDERKTMTGQVFGTLPYMSPEQVQGQAGAMGKGCDIYSLGVIFYELLTGRLPFEGQAWELPQQIIQVAPAVPSSIVPGIDLEVDAIVLKAMAKSIGRRFDSMTQFAEAIAAYLRKVGSLSGSGVTPRYSDRAERIASPPALNLSPSPKRRGGIFAIDLRPEPLRGRAFRRSRSRDGLIWGVMAILALIVIPLVIMHERETAGTPAPGPKPVAAKPDAARVPRPTSNRTDPGKGRVVEAR